MGYCGRVGPEEDWYAPFTVTVLVFEPEPPVAMTTCGSRIRVPGGCDVPDMAVAWRGIVALVSLTFPSWMNNFFKIPLSSVSEIPSELTTF